MPQEAQRRGSTCPPAALPLSINANRGIAACNVSAMMKPSHLPPQDRPLTLRRVCAPTAPPGRRVTAAPVCAPPERPCVCSMRYEHAGHTGMLLLLLAALLLAGSAAGAQLQGNATREVLLSTSSRYLSAAGVQLAGGALLSSSQATGEICASKCFDEGPKCSWFSTLCDAAQASPGGSAGELLGGPAAAAAARAAPPRSPPHPCPCPSLQACRCDLFTSNCTLAPSVSNQAAAAGTTVTSGEAVGWRIRAARACVPLPPKPAQPSPVGLFCNCCPGRSVAVPHAAYPCRPANMSARSVCRRAAPLRAAGFGYLCGRGWAGGGGCRPARLPRVAAAGSVRLHHTHGRRADLHPAGGVQRRECVLER